MNHISFFWYMFGFLSCLCVWIGVVIWKTPEDEESRAELRMMIEMGSHSGNIQGHKFPWWKNKKHI